MEGKNIESTEQDFISHFSQNASHLMWFLGAGTSRSAGMPTATDIIWDLKRKYYCLQENQILQTHDVTNKAIQNKVQQYLDSRGFPALWSPEEYSFYFDLTFGQDYGSQQRYIQNQLDPRKVSLNIGHKALAALLGVGGAKIAFTTNFDEVIEFAYSSVTGENLPTFHLEGSYAALDALNAEKFPIYAKIHGDFRYRSVKNLSTDLLQNDDKIQKCFLAASNRYGLVVTGYSGRDDNVMRMFRLALEQTNPFPQGLFWATTKISSTAKSVCELIAYAQSRGVRASIVETGTFDIMLSKLWRQLPGKTTSLDLKVQTAKAVSVSIPFPPVGSRYPILRTNALAVTEVPKQCGTIDYASTITFQELNDKVWNQKPAAVTAYSDRILFWGNSKSVCDLLDPTHIRAVQSYVFEGEGLVKEESTIMKSFLEHALATALCQDRPLKLNRKNRSYYLVVDHDRRDDSRLEELKSVLGKGNPTNITGQVLGLDRTFWAEALSIKIEQRNGGIWLLIEPDIWISPLSQRERATDFLREKKLRRYNPQSFDLLSAWILLLFGSVGGAEVAVSCYPKSDYAATFRVNTRTAYSHGGGASA